MIKTASLTPILRQVIQDKGTEYPFTGPYNELDQSGSYLCRQCGLALFRSKDKFHSGCGWPSFDNEVANAVKRQMDKDGKREEILCQRCNAHLGHVFIGEHFTPLNIRHCVNSLSLDFVTDETVLDSQEAILAAGCFWGVEYFFKRFPGVLKVESGYSGGALSSPTYEAICKGNTGHYEVVRVLFDPQVTDFTKIAQHFFEIHDPEQQNGQGPDIGAQYLSVLFYYDEEQYNVAQSLVQRLSNNGMSVATKILPVTIFWPAESYHQDYYQKTNKAPYCHRYIKRFE